MGLNLGSVENCHNTGTVTGTGDYVGGVVGDNRGSVINCYNTGTVSGNRVGGVVGYNISSVTNCYNTGTVTGTDDYVGGVVGYNISSVTNCYNTGSVKGNSYVGGVVGDNGGSVENCYNTGAVNSSGNYVGGVVGDNRGSVKNCYNTGAVSGSDWYVGGVVGLNRGSTVENCYNIGEVSGPDSVSGSSVGGVVGYNIIGNVTNCYFLQGTAEKGIGVNEGNDSADATRVDDLDALCNALASDINTWSISPFYDHPVLKTNPEGGDGTAAHPYEIKTADQLETFRDLVNGEGGNPDAHAKLMNDIDLSSVCGENAGESGQSVSWTPIGNEDHLYTGTFDGNGNTISGLYINNSTADYQGLFGRVNGGTVQNLTVSGNVSGDRHVGGVVGYNSSGTVTGCTFSGSGSVTGREDVGGVVGSNSGTVENCYNTGKVSGHDSGSGSYVGGVVGLNRNGSVENCYNTVIVTGTDDYVGGVVGYNGSSSTVENCYNTGSVTGSYYVGGVVGRNDGSVKNCYYQQHDPAIFGIGGTTADDTTTVAKTAEQFASGEVAHLLEQNVADSEKPVWGQNIKDGKKDNYPQLRAFDADTPQVYKVAFMNDSEEHDAKYANRGMTVVSPTNNPTK